MMTLGVVMTACKKDEDTKVTFEGNQWISEEMEADGDFPAGKYLLDIGAKSGAGKATSLILVTESNKFFTEGDLVLIKSESYTYDSATGKFSGKGGSEALVEFISDKTIKFTSGGMALIFSLVEGKQYPVKDAKEFEPAPEEFEITPSKTADWAGGSITFTSDRTIKSMTYDVLTEGLTEQESCKTTLTEDQVLTLGQYLAAGSALANCQIQIKAADEDGNETTCIVTSKAWRPAVYTEYKDTFTQDHLDNGWSRGQACWLGALCADGEIPYEGTSDTFGGIDYAVPSFMEPFGSKSNKVGFDTPADNSSGIITYTYGALSFELTIDIDR
jgi:hypothetical protein